MGVLGAGHGKSKAEVVLGPQNCPDHKLGCLSTREAGGALPSTPATLQAEKVRLLCPNFCLLAGLPRCAPQQCESFTVDSSPGVVVQIYGTDPVKIGEEAAMNWWPLSRPTNVLVGMTSPSSANDKGKVGLGGGR